MPDFHLPDLGEGLTTASVIAWTVAIGDEVRVDQLVVEVETIKARVEIPIPFDGVVTAIYASAGEEVNVGQPLLNIEQSSTRDSPRVVRAPDSVETDSKRHRESTPILVGFGSSEHLESSTLPRESQITTTAAIASPALRRVARERGIDLTMVSGTGPAGVITRNDIEAAAVSGHKESDTVGDVGLAPKGADVARIPISGPAASRSVKYSQSRSEIPEATIWVDIDASELLQFCESRFDTTKSNVSTLLLISYFVTHSLRRFPELNSVITKGHIVRSERVNLGIATSVDGAVRVPVVHAVDQMGFVEFVDSFSSILDAARSEAVGSDLFRDGTFTINDYGDMGVDGSVPIINYPEVAIIGLGQIRMRPWAIDSALTVRPILQVTLSFDHRTCEGIVASDFLRFVKTCIESPRQSLQTLDPGSLDATTPTSEKEASAVAAPESKDADVSRAATLRLIMEETASLLGKFDTLGLQSSFTFKDMGLTSKMAVLLRNRLMDRTGLRLGATVIFDFPTPDKLSVHVLDLLQPDEASLVAQIKSDLIRLRAELEKIDNPEDAAAVSAMLTDLANSCSATPRQLTEDLANASDEQLFAELDGRTQ